MKSTLALALGGLGLASLSFAQEVPPGNFIPPAAEQKATLVPVVSRVTLAQSQPTTGEAFATTMKEAKVAYAKTRDYMAHLVRQERVNGTLLSEQTGELRVRVEPFCISLQLVAPKGMNGWDACYVSGKYDGKLRFRANSAANYTTIPVDDAKVMSQSRHTLRETGMGALLQRVDRILEAEKKAGNPVQIAVSDYTFDQRPVKRYELFTERPHPNRYAHRVVLYFDAATKLPVRFEAYDQPKGIGMSGELLEVVSFVNVKLNSGLGDKSFER